MLDPAPSDRRERERARSACTPSARRTRGARTIAGGVERHRVAERRVPPGPCRGRPPSGRTPTERSPEGVARLARSRRPRLVESRSRSTRQNRPSCSLRAAARRLPAPHRGAAVGPRAVDEPGPRPVPSRTPIEPSRSRRSTRASCQLPPSLRCQRTRSPGRRPTSSSALSARAPGVRSRGRTVSASRPARGAGACACRRASGRGPSALRCT